MAVEKLGASFNQIQFPLKYTPRKMVVHPAAGTLIVVEADHLSYTEATKEKKRTEMAKEIENLATNEEEQVLAQEIADGIKNNKPNEAQFGAPRAAAAKYASCVRIVHPRTGDSLAYFPLPQDEAAKWLFSPMFCRLAHF